jgi:hypothetical protein
LAAAEGVRGLSPCPIRLFQRVRQAFICYLLFAICHALRPRLCVTLGKAQQAVRSERALEIRPAAEEDREKHDHTEVSKDGVKQKVAKAST